MHDNDSHRRPYGEKAGLGPARAWAAIRQLRGSAALAPAESDEDVVQALDRTIAETVDALEERELHLRQVRKALRRERDAAASAKEELAEARDLFAASLSIRRHELEASVCRVEELDAKLLTERSEILNERDLRLAAEKDVKTLAAERDELYTTVADARAQVTAAAAELKEKVAALAEANDRCDQLSRDLGSRLDDLRCARAEIARLADEGERLSERVRATDQALEGASVQERRLHDDVAAARAEHDATTAELIDTRGVLAQLAEERAALDRELAQMRAALQQASAIQEQTQQRYEAEIAEAGTRSQAAREDAERHQIALNEAHASVEALRARCDDQEAARKELESRVESLVKADQRAEARERLQSAATRDRLNRELERAAAEKAQLLQQVEQLSALQAELGLAQNELDGARAQAGAVASENEALRQESSSRDEELNQVRAEAARSAEDLDEARSAAQQLDAQLEATCRELERRKEAYVTARDEADHSAGVAKRLQAEASRREAELAGARATSNDLGERLRVADEERAAQALALEDAQAIAEAAKVALELQRGEVETEVKAGSRLGSEAEGSAQELNQLREQLGRRAQELQERHHEGERLAEELHAIKGELGERRGQLEAAEAQREQHREELTARDEELAALRDELRKAAEEVEAQAVQMKAAGDEAARQRARGDRAFAELASAREGLAQTNLMQHEEPAPTALMPLTESTERMLDTSQASSEAVPAVELDLARLRAFDDYELAEVFVTMRAAWLEELARGPRPEASRWHVGSVAVVQEAASREAFGEPSDASRTVPWKRLGKHRRERARNELAEACRHLTEGTLDLFIPPAAESRRSGIHLPQPLKHVDERPPVKPPDAEMYPDALVGRLGTASLESLVGTYQAAREMMDSGDPEQARWWSTVASAVVAEASHRESLDVTDEKALMSGTRRFGRRRRQQALTALRSELDRLDDVGAAAGDGSPEQGQSSD